MHICKGFDELARLPSRGSPWRFILPPAGATVPGSLYPSQPPPALGMVPLETYQPVITDSSLQFTLKHCRVSAALRVLGTPKPAGVAEVRLKGFINRGSESTATSLAGLTRRGGGQQLSHQAQTCLCLHVGPCAPLAVSPCTGARALWLRALLHRRGLW